MILQVVTFDTNSSDKRQAVKVLEEAAEVYAAWKELEAATKLAEKGLMSGDSLDGYEDALAEEVADVITASCNLGKMLGLDIPQAMAECYLKNKARGYC